MQDIMAKLQEILSTKEGQNQLSSIASMLNQSQPSQPEQVTQPVQQNQGFDLSSLAAMFSSPVPQENAAGEQTSQNANPLGSIDMNMIMNLQKMVGGLSGGANDKNAALLLALKPHFSEKRQEKVDKALTLMKLVALLPMLKESGILKGIL